MISSMYKKNFIHSIYLQNYRNFRELKLKISNKTILIHGPNGGGKSNILESISFLAPGRGFRKTILEDVIKIGENYWRSNISLDSNVGKAEIQNIFSNKTRKLCYNGNKITNCDLTKIVNIIWLIPQMHHIFLAPSVERRKFLDRIVGNFEDQHLKNLLAHEKLTNKRLSFCKENSNIQNSQFLDSIEHKISYYSYQIFKKRIEVKNLIQNSLNFLDNIFPSTQLEILYKNDLFKESSDKEKFTEYLRIELKNNREKDKIYNRTICNVHRVDFFVVHCKKKIPAKFCSTGEQKIMLIAIIIAQVNSLISKRNFYPILILDEVFVHLDLKHREFLTNFIFSSQIQSFITANDIFYLQQMMDNVQLIEIR